MWAYKFILHHRKLWNSHSISVSWYLSISVCWSNSQRWISKRKKLHKIKNTRVSSAIIAAKYTCTLDITYNWSPANYFESCVPNKDTNHKWKNCFYFSSNQHDGYLTITVHFLTKWQLLTAKDISNMFVNVMKGIMSIRGVTLYTQALIISFQK